ncbi:MAG: biotin/lipoyl-containing protein [Burkholderiaceae bacterium]
MKMEIPLVATQDGTLIELLVAEGTPVAAGQKIVILKSIELVD